MQPCLYGDDMIDSSVGNTTPITTAIVNELIIAGKKSFGKFHKCIFHLHTPASHDYKCNENEDNLVLFKDAKLDDLLELGKANGLINDGLLLDQFSDISSIFKSREEYFGYWLIGRKLVKEGIELVVISDHNTTSGYKKLVSVLQDIKKSYAFKIPNTILGIEISCSDKMHVIGIFDVNTTNENIVEEWIRENRISLSDGTFLTSIEVFTKIHALGGIGYIAHINSSAIFDKIYLSSAYKSRLLSLEYMNTIGISNRDQLQSTLNRIKEYNNREFRAIMDEDAHSVASIGKKYFWIKGSGCGFHMIKKALVDYSISIDLEDPCPPDAFIKALYAMPGDTGFLCGKNEDEPFKVVFSPSLNCFIGGRGTGKSTILNILEFMLTQNYMNENMLELMCSYKHIVVIYSLCKKDYLIEFFAPQRDFKGQSMSEYMRSFSPNKYTHILSPTPDISKVIRDEFIHVYNLDLNKEFFHRGIEINRLEKRALLERFMNSKYSVNDLVNRANRERISEFIIANMFRNRVISSPRQTSRILSTDTFLAYLESIGTEMLKRKTEVMTEIESFNIQNKDVLQIVYSQNFESYLPDIMRILNYRQSDRNQLFGSYDISYMNVNNYLHRLYDRIDGIKLLTHLVKREYDNLNRIESIIDFYADSKANSGNVRAVEISQKNYKNFFEALRGVVLSQYNIKTMVNDLRRNICKFEHFDIQFNINNKEGDTTSRPIFKNVSELSLGQTVVAMLTFVLSYGKYADDLTPLIIDQPEDNLDNRYIYKNLVRKLREMKSERQVIIATHSATIVTNALAEQVIVMKSDNSHGWIADTGYPSDKKIVGHILDNLEGGVESFRHKSFIYDELIKEKHK